MVAPVIMAFGTDEQKAQHLPPILHSDIWWCQGYSEPGSGSDLASLQMKRRAGRRRLHPQRLEDLDHPRPVGRLDVLPGAHRQEGKPQNGISFLLLRMDTPGITVKRPADARRPAPKASRKSTRSSSTTSACRSANARSARRIRAGPTPSTCSSSSAATPTRPACEPAARRCARSPRPSEETAASR